MTSRRVETTGVAASGDHGGPDKWLIDTGSGYDLVGRNDVPGWAMDSMLEDSSPIDLHTANGITTVDKTVSLQVMGLMEAVKPLVLQSTPAVLSVGKRCMEEGWSFVWNAGENPWLVSP